MSTLTNIGKHAGSLTNVSRVAGSGVIFYAWMFWFTIPVYSTNLANFPKHDTALTNIAI
jgi:hypothetical protein